MEAFEKKANEDALARRAKRQPSQTKNTITVVPVYCKGCTLCVEVCPTGTLLLEDNIESKFGVSVRVDAEDHCIGCKMCEFRCPDFAIFVNYENDAENEDEDNNE